MSENLKRIECLEHVGMYSSLKRIECLEHVGMYSYRTLYNVSNCKHH